MKVTATKLVISLIIFTLLDFIWIFSNYNRYNDMVKHITGSQITLNYSGVIITYIILFLGLICFVLPNVDNSGVNSIITSSFHYGGLFGFVVYGVYSFTNLSIFKQYRLNIAILDTVWGTGLFILTSILTSIFG